MCSFKNGHREGALIVFLGWVLAKFVAAASETKSVGGFRVQPRSGGRCAIAKAAIAPVVLDHGRSITPVAGWHWLLATS